MKELNLLEKICGGKIIVGEIFDGTFISRSLGGGALFKDSYCYIKDNKGREYDIDLNDLKMELIGKRVRVKTFYYSFTPIRFIKEYEILS